ncbi:UNVERIFIED_CONTAM: hypothetical protein Sangu_1688100 [Sesamum angustifolium]|uniref:Uncharacterized protein n=1 Tax=Sesamum angustifolium TaxID=2727405 RepID=A0AAW2MJY2_9LAMI
MGHHSNAYKTQVHYFTRDGTISSTNITHSVRYGATLLGAMQFQKTSSTGATSPSPWFPINGTTSTASGPAPQPSFRMAS